MSRVAIAVAAAALSAALVPAPSAAAPVARVKIEATKFDPAVVVVPPGATVRWANADLRTRSLRGEVESPPIPAGGNFEERFPRPGVYEYEDGGNRLLTGTVIVAVGGGRAPHYPEPGGGSRIVAHHWRVTLRFDVRESWKYLDGKFMSFEGLCNAQVGGGSRTVSFEARFPDVVYRRLGRLEVMSGRGPPYRIQRYLERIESKSSDPSHGETSVDCGDGSRDPPATIEQDCNHDYSRFRVRPELFWSPKEVQGRFQWSQDYVGPHPPHDANCGHDIISAGVLVGLDPEKLPWDPGPGNWLRYDSGHTGSATPSEARALRAGRALTVERRFELHFTADCCLEWHEQGRPGTYVRVGARHEAKGKVTIRFAPR